MAGGRGGTPGPRGAARTGRALALALVLAALTTPPAPAEPDVGAPPAPAYGSSDLDRRQGESADPGDLRAEPSAPAFGAETVDPGAREGSSQPLGAVAHPPRGRSPDARAEDVAPEPVRVAPLRLRRRPDVAAAPSRTLPERLCEAERDLEHARREHRDAVRAYKRARREEHPRGAARRLIVEHRALAARRVERAEAAHGALLAEAEAEDAPVGASACRRGL